MPLNKLHYHLALCSALLLLVAFKAQAIVVQNNSAAVKIIGEILARPDAEIDLARTKLTIDKFVDPSIDIEQSLNDLNRIAQAVNSAATANMTAMDRLQSLRTYLYASGYWNDNQPFQYDFDDPLGTNIQNKLLPNYLRNKKGNCFSMPFLFVILAAKLGLEATIATAPLHVFVKFKEPQTGKMYNLEATDIAQLVEDSFYKEKSPMTDTAINNGVYLKALSKKEAVAVMAVVLSEHYAEKQKWQQSIDISTLILKHYPKYAYAMIKIGNAYSKLLQQNVQLARAKGSVMPAEKAAMDQLYAQNLLWFAKAEKLGWQPPPQASTTRYLESISKRVQQPTSKITQNEGQ